MSLFNNKLVEGDVQEQANSSARPSAPLKEKTWNFKTGFLLASFFFIILNSAPFSDAARFRKAIEACEKNLPRAQHCDVQGVVVLAPPVTAIVPTSINP